MFNWMQNIELPRNPTILDVGANIGLFSMSYASIFEGAEIHSFEPVPFIYNYLKRNLEINPKLSSDINAHLFGMSNCIECKQLSIPAAQQHERYNDQSDIRLFSVLGQGTEKFDARFTNQSTASGGLPLRLQVKTNTPPASGTSVTMKVWRL